MILKLLPDGQFVQAYVEIMLARMGLTRGADRQDGNAEINIGPKTPSNRLP